MALFTDTVTIYQKKDNWEPKVVKGVQWSEKTERLNNNGKLSISKCIAVTFPFPIALDPYSSEDAIVYGEIDTFVTDEKNMRISDLLKEHRGGLIKSVNDNSNRDYLPNVKVVLQ